MNATAPATTTHPGSARGRIYFDWNSTTPPLREALEAQMRAYTEAWGNPSAVHAEGRLARTFLEDARVAIAELVDGRPGDVVLTSGGTEASNLAMRSPFQVTSTGAVLLSPIEHASILSVATRLQELGVEVRRARVLSNGVVDVADIERLLQLGGTRIVALQAVNGETGVIQPVAQVAALARAHGAVVHVDAIQAIGRVAPPPGGWLAHADTVAIASHKIRGPKGIGALVTRPGHPVRPLLRGGSQERGLRPGTQDAALASGFAVAARAARSSLATYQAVAAVRDRLERGLLALGSHVAINGDGPRAPHVVHASFRDWSSPELVAALDLDGLAASGGSACHAGVAEPSSTLAAMWGDRPAEHWRLEGTVRFSLPPTTTVEEVDRALAILGATLARGTGALFGAAE